MMFKRLNYVLNFIPNSLKENQNDTEQWLSWALQASRSIQSQDLKLRNLTILAVEDHRVCLPKGLKRITDIKMLIKEPTEQELESLTQAVTYDNYKEAAGDLTAEATESFTGYTIYHQLVLNSDYLKNNWQPMRYVGTAGHKDYFEGECWKIINGEECNNCFNEFSITVDGCILTQAKEGYIVLGYETELVNENGEFVFPEEPVHMWKAMASYCMYRHWENRIGYHEENSFRLAEYYRAQYASYLREAKGIFKLKALSYRAQYYAIYGDAAIMNLSTLFKAA
jgi:hypothetical protein